MIDDITPLRNIITDVMKSKFWLYQPRGTYRIGGSGRSGGLTSGVNLQSGVLFNYYFKDMPDSNSVELKIYDDSENIIRTFKPKTKERGDRLPIKKGLNRITWNMRYPDAERFDGMILWGGGGMTGPLAIPGNYKAILIYNKDSLSVPFTILKDPRSSSSIMDLQSQFDFLISVRNKLTETHKAIKQIRNIRKQIKDVGERIKEQKNIEPIKKLSDEINKKIAAIEESLYQTKNKSPQDPLNYPVRLNDKLSSLGGSASSGDFRPTDQAVELKKELISKIDAELIKLKEIVESEIPKFNKLVAEANVPAVILQQEEKK